MTTTIEHRSAPDTAVAPTVDRDRILTMTVRYLDLLRERYGLRPAEAFVYAWSDALLGANYRMCEFYPYRPEEPLAAYFEAIRYLFQMPAFGGWSFGLVQDDPGTGPRLRGARAFLGFEDGELRLQFYNLKDEQILAEVRALLRRAFAGQAVTVQVFP